MKKRMYLKKYRLFTIPVSLVVLMLTIYSIATYDESKYFQTVYPTPVIDKQADEQFVQIYGKGIEINKGLTISRERLGVPIKGPTPSPNDLLLIVKNNSEEDIQFHNTDFNLQVYVYNGTQQAWIRFDFPKANSKVVIIPSKLNNKRNYDYIAVSSDIANDISQQKLRFFVVGTGIKTGKKYGAYCDVTIIP